MKSAGSPELWKTRYEALRQHALDGGNILATPPLGLHLLCRQGVAGWMKRWTEATERSFMGSPPSPPLVLGVAQWQEQLTLLLAQMTFPQIHCARTP